MDKLQKDKKETDKYQALCDNYQMLRDNQLAKSITIDTEMGEYKITNKAAINQVLDLLIALTQKRIEQIIYQ